MKLADYLVLGTIEQCGPSSGYDIVQELELREVPSWTHLKIGSVYHAIAKLEKKSFIVALETTQQGSRPTKTIYEITKKGQSYFDDLQDESFKGLYPNYYGMLLGLVFNLRRPVEDIENYAKNAHKNICEKMDEMKTKECDVSRLPEEIQPLIGKRVEIYRRHIQKQMNAEKEWIEDVLENIDIFDNSEICKMKYKGREIT